MESTSMVCATLSCPDTPLCVLNNMVEDLEALQWHKRGKIQVHLTKLYPSSASQRYDLTGYFLTWCVKVLIEFWKHSLA